MSFALVWGWCSVMYYARIQMPALTIMIQKVMGASPKLSIERSQSRGCHEYLEKYIDSRETPGFKGGGLAYSQCPTFAPHGL